MVKLKTPLLGLEAHGSLGNALTFQGRNRGTIVRTKPKPTDPKTLAQIYHRWLYQDYSAWWNTLSAADQALWETNARQLKITGFNYWMRNRLINLTALVAGYHLDTAPDSTAVDFSKNANHGTIYGATLAPGLIHRALFFDGLDDFVQTAPASSLDITGDITLEAFVRRLAAGERFIISKWKIATNERCFGLVYLVDNKVSFFRSSNGQWNAGEILTTADTIDTDWHHLLATQDGTNAYIFIDGVEKASGAHVTLHDRPLLPLELGRYNDGGYHNGLLDQVIVYNRSLTQTDAERHSERRYPL